MALIACEECKREISDRAAACPHCGCPIAREPSEPARPAEAKAAAKSERVPEVKVNVAMPPGLGAATADAIKSAASSKAWGRLYQTLRFVAVVCLAACGIGAVVIYQQTEERGRQRLQEAQAKAARLSLPDSSRSDDEAADHRPLDRRDG